MAYLWQIGQSGGYGGLIESKLEVDLGLFRMVLCLVYIY